MKKLVTLLLFFAVAFFVSGSAAPGTGYSGSSKSNIYHLPSCQHAKKILESNRIVFPTKEDAQKKGYRPCKVCKP